MPGRQQDCGWLRAEHDAASISQRGLRACAVRRRRRRGCAAYCARGFSRLRKSFLEIITLKIVQQVSRFLAFFFFFLPSLFNAELCTLHFRRHQTRSAEAASPFPKPPSPRVVSAGSAGRRLLIRRDANGEERGQTARDNASDGDKKCFHGAAQQNKNRCPFI